MKKSIIAFLILLSFLSLAAYAQTDAEITDRAEKLAKKLIDESLNEEREKLAKLTKQYLEYQFEAEKFERIAKTESANWGKKEDEARAAKFKELANEQRVQALWRANRVSRVDPFNEQMLSERAIFIANDKWKYGDVDEVATFLKLIEIAPKNINGYNAFANYLLNLGFPAEADKYFAKTIELASPDKWVFEHNRGVAAFYAGNYPLCIESMQKALTLQPKNDHRWTYAYLSFCYGLQGGKNNAEANLKKAVALGGAMISESVEVASGAYYAGKPKCKTESQMNENIAKQKTLGRQYAVFFQAYQCYPNNQDIVSWGVEIAKLDESLNLLRRALTVKAAKLKDPAYPPLDQLAAERIERETGYKKNQATEALAKREYDYSLQLANVVLAANPNDLSGYYLRATALLEMPGYELLAWREANKMLAISPRSVYAREIRARVFLDQFQNYEKALAEVEQSFKDNPGVKKGSLYIIRGKISYKNKNYAKALADFDAALQILPDSAEATKYKYLAMNPQKDESQYLWYFNETSALIRLWNDGVKKYDNELKKAGSNGERCGIAKAHLSEEQSIRSNYIKLRTYVDAALEPKFNENLANFDRNIASLQKIIGEFCK